MRAVAASDCLHKPRSKEGVGLTMAKCRSLREIATSQFDNLNPGCRIFSRFAMQTSPKRKTGSLGRPGLHFFGDEYGTLDLARGAHFGPLGGFCSTGGGERGRTGSGIRP